MSLFSVLWPKANRRALLYTGRKTRILTTAAIAGTIIFVITVTFHWLLGEQFHLLARESAADLVAALVVAYFAYVALRAERQRALRAAAELKMIADMNHHIRNALDMLTMSAYGTDDKAAVAVIQKATERITWALREVLPSREIERRRIMGGRTEDEARQH